MDYESALSLLRSPHTWCRGAEALAQLDEARALLPLMRAYERRTERSKVCLLDAMDALGARRHARALLDAAASPDERRLVIHLMELFPDEDHLAALEQAVTQGDAPLRYQAARTLVCQPQTESWERVMRGLLEAEDERVRAWAIEGLGYCRRASARNALRDRLAGEPSAELRARLVHIVGDDSPPAA